VADAKLTLAALKAALEKQVTGPSAIASTPRAQEIAAMVEECRQEFAPQMNAETMPIKTPRLMRDIQPFIDADTLVVDAGACSYWAPAYLDLHRKTRSCTLAVLPHSGLHFPWPWGHSWPIRTSVSSIFAVTVPTVITLWSLRQRSG